MKHNTILFQIVKINNLKSNEKCFIIHQSLNTKSVYILYTNGDKNETLTTQLWY